MISKKVFLLILLLLVIIVFPLSIITYNHIEEDTFITLRYVENFVNGKGLVYNEGEHVEGYSNFLWCIMLAVAKYLGFNSINSTKVLNLIFYALLIAIVPLYFTNIKDKRIPIWVLFPSLLLLFNPMIHYQSDRGLEAISYSFFIVTAVLFFIKRNYLVSSIFFIGVALSRPEGFIYFGIFLFVFLIDNNLYKFKNSNRQNIINLEKFVLPFILIFGIYINWRYHYYGWLLPNSVYFKVPKLNFMRNPSIDEFWQFIVSFSFIPLFSLFAIYLLFLKSYNKKENYLFYLLFYFLFIHISLELGKYQHQHSDIISPLYHLLLFCQPKYYMK